MKKMFVCLIICAAALIPTVNAESLEDEVIASLPSDIQNEAREYSALDITDGVSGIVKSSVSQMKGTAAKLLSSGVTIVLVIILGAMVSSVDGKTKRTASLAVCLAVCAVSIKEAGNMIGLGTRVLSELDVFSKALFPAVAASGAAAGQAGSSAAVCALSLFFADILLSLITRVLLPLVYVYIAAAVAASAVGSQGLDTVCKLIKSLTTTVLTAAMSAFVLFLNISKVVSSSADAAIVKAAKTTISTAIPVVGSIISDAAESVAAGASLARGALGVTGTIGVFALCTLPFMQVGAQYLLYKGAAIIGGTVGDGSVSALCSKISTAFGMVLGMIGSCAFLVFMSILCAIKITA